MPSAPKHSDGLFWPDGARVAVSRQFETGSQPDWGAESPFTKKTIRAGNGLRLVGEVRGQGDTALVFLQGWCGDREYWKHQVGPFAADYRKSSRKAEARLCRRDDSRIRAKHGLPSPDSLNL